jgi:segregation and condensation protein B
MGLKGKVEAIIYAAEEPVTLEQISTALKDSVAAEQAAGNNEGEPAAVDIKEQIRAAIEELAAEYANSDRGMELRQIAGGWRMGTKPEHHDAVRGFAKSLKPPVRLSLQALETLAVIAYKQPVTVPEISEIRGVDSGGVIGTLLDRKLITTAGRKAVIGRPILYRTSKEFLLRFGLKDVTDLPSLEEFEKLAAESEQLFEGRHGENGMPVSEAPPVDAEAPGPEAKPADSAEDKPVAFASGADVSIAPDAATDAPAPESRVPESEATSANADGESVIRN